MSGLDIALLVVTALVAISGYIEGFVLGACATLGLLAGAAVGVYGVPRVLDQFSPSVEVSFAALVLVVILASIGRTVGALLGSRLRNKISWKPVKAVDALGGAVLAAVSVLVVSWVLGVAVSGARIPSVTSAVRGSQVLAKVDQALPSGADNALQAFNDVVNTDLFPRFLDPFVRSGSARRSRRTARSPATQRSARRTAGSRRSPASRTARAVSRAADRLRPAAGDDERARRRSCQFAEGEDERAQYELRRAVAPASTSPCSTS